MLLRRRLFDRSLRQSQIEQAITHLFQHDIFQKSQHIACYLATPDEFDCTAIIEKIWQEKKYCYLPVVNDKKQLEFFRYQRHDGLIENRYRILEPRQRNDKILIHELDCVLLPLVAFDREGYRLGMGGGYYDRTFAHATRVRLVGLAYDFQQWPQLPRDVWDVKLQDVVTPQRVITF